MSATNEIAKTQEDKTNFVLKCNTLELLKWAEEEYIIPIEE